jgi:hypothetical protein
MSRLPPCKPQPKALPEERGGSMKWHICSHPDCEKVAAHDTDLGWLCRGHFTEAVAICNDERQKIELEEMKCSEVIQ